MKTMVYFGRQQFLPEIAWKYLTPSDNTLLEDRIKEKYRNFYPQNEKFIEGSMKLLTTQTERLIKIMPFCDVIGTQEKEIIPVYKAKLLESAHILQCDIEEAFLQSLSISKLDQSSRRLEGAVLKEKIKESYGVFSNVNEDFCNYLIELSHSILPTAPHNSRGWIKGLQIELRTQHENYYNQARKMMQKCFQTFLLV